MVLLEAAVLDDMNLRTPRTEPGHVLLLRPVHVGISPSTPSLPHHPHRPHQPELRQPLAFSEDLALAAGADADVARERGRAAAIAVQAAQEGMTLGMGLWERLAHT